MYLYSTANKMQRYLDLFISVNCSTCFGGSFAHHQEHMSVHTASGIVKPILLPAAIVDEMELRSIGLTIPDAVCTVMCS
jgi:hypothetical protein